MAAGLSSEEAFKLGLAVLLNDPTVASATQSLSELMDKTTFTWLIRSASI